MQLWKINRANMDRLIDVLFGTVDSGVIFVYSGLNRSPDSFCESITTAQYIYVLIMSQQASHF